MGDNNDAIIPPYQPETGAGANKGFTLTTDPIIQKKRKQHIMTTFPGHVNYAMVDRHTPGCKAMTFANEEALNTFFAENLGLLVVHLQAFEDESIFVLYSRTLSDEDMEEFTEFQSDFERFQSERRAKREELKAKEKEQLDALNKKAREEHEAKLKELERLAEKGRTCEIHHGKKTGKK